MPVNKQQRHRLYLIDERLNRYGQNSFVTPEELINLCKVSRSTFMADIEFMRLEYEAPIAYNRKQKSYYYSSPFQLSSQIPLSKEEINALKIAGKTLSQFKHLSAFENLPGIIDRIEHAIKFKVDSPKGNYLYFEHVPSYEGAKLLSLIIEAIESQQKIRFTYSSFKSGKTHNPILHPYALKEHTNRWYVIGYQPEWEEIYSFALDRIEDKSLELLDSFFQPDPNFDIMEYYKYSLGTTVLNQEEPQNIILSFTPLQAKYFKSKPFHPFTPISESSEEIIVSMKLIPNYELLRKLAGMGNGVKVLEPISLQKDLRNYLEDALLQYKS
ncbi:MAG: WYL domain-containing protein [Bacteroidota bacterium]